MSTFGNIMWVLFGGFLDAIAYVFAGCLFCVTIVGIPFGMQCFKLAKLCFWPFGKEIEYSNGAGSFLANVIWLIFFGWEMALANLAFALIWCITIVGVPFGKQFFKLARLSLMPFGAKIK